MNKLLFKTKMACSFHFFVNVINSVSNMEDNLSRWASNRSERRTRFGAGRVLPKLLPLTAGGDERCATSREPIHEAVCFPSFVWARCSPSAPGGQSCDAGRDRRGVRQALGPDQGWAPGGGKAADRHGCVSVHVRDAPAGRPALASPTS